MLRLESLVRLIVMFLYSLVACMFYKKACGLWFVSAAVAVAALNIVYMFCLAAACSSYKHGLGSLWME